MLNSTGSIDFFRPIQNNISFLDQLERAYTMDSYKINMENRDEEFNRVYNKQVKKTLDSCRDYLESRKTKGWTEKGNERFNNILKFYGRYRKEDAQRILNERNDIIDGVNGESRWFFKQNQRFATIDALVFKPTVVPVQIMERDLIESISRRWDEVAGSKGGEFMNLRRTDIKRIMESKAFKNVVDRHVNESDRYNVTEKNMQISLAREFKLEMRKLNNEAKSKDNNQEIKEKAPAKKVVNVQKI